MNESKLLKELQYKHEFKACEKIELILKKFTEETNLQVKEISISYQDIGGICHGDVVVNFKNKKDISREMEDYYDYRFSKR